ncbi:MAG: biotin--[acetyl-CoA-carboxylase] ligase, partial [Deltaproteobacteria bacterium]|nr:biotin--[acetyl-CoA-carboxylase] ligase [Deltaproteobacteria bacterium]
MPDERAVADLDVAALAAAITTTWLGRRHIHVATCGSTNDLVAVEARAGADEGLLITADEQRGGRGRQGRVWHSPAGTNVYMSLLLRPRRPALEIPPLTLLAGGALADALRGLGFNARVKWPNDLLLGCADGRRRKVAGILTEATTEGDRIGHVVVGMGLNVNAGIDDFPVELTDKATSLRLISGGAPLSRVDVLARVLSAFESAYERFQTKGVAAAIALWEAHADLGQLCRAQVNGREIAGRTVGVAADGAL